jgi:hypothetical protein
MILHSDLVWCTGCGLEISWGPFYKDKLPYCCEDCAHGLPCHCAEHLELDEDEYHLSAPALPQQ